MTRNQLGEMALINLVPTQTIPTITLTYPSLFAEKYVTGVGYQAENRVFSVKYTKFTQVPTSLNIPAVAAGKYGFSLVEDSPGFGSKELNGISVPITQQTYATFNPATPDTWAVGDNGDLLFSTNLADEFVTLQIDMDVSGTGFSDTITGEYEVSATLVNTLLQISHLYIPSAIIDPTGKSLDPSAESFEIMMYLLTSGSCRAYDLVDTQETVDCSIL